MHIVFSYNSIEEIKNIIEITFHKNEYKDLRSVVYPSFGKFIGQKVIQEKKIEQLNKHWPAIEINFNKALDDLELKNTLNNVICFVHTFGCEGWFNVDRNQIHIRTEESTLENTIDSIMHEVFHLVTYKIGSTYNEREKLVDKCMSMESIKRLRAEINNIN